MSDHDKKAEEIVQESEYKSYRCSELTGLNKDVLRDAISAALAEAGKNAAKWTPVEEGLPTTTNDSWFTTMDGAVERGYFSNGYVYFGEDDVAPISQIVAWMPVAIPAPYAPNP